MKVRALVGRSFGPWFIPGKIYSVIEIYIKKSSQVNYRIESELGSPVYHAAADFEIVDPEIHSGWVVDVQSGAFMFAPREFAQQNFWVDYFDDEPGALATYEDVKKRMGW